jgi:hypothetical protein
MCEANGYKMIITVAYTFGTFIASILYTLARTTWVCSAGYIYELVWQVIKYKAKLGHPECNNGTVRLLMANITYKKRERERVPYI